MKNIFSKKEDSSITSSSKGFLIDRQPQQIQVLEQEQEQQQTLSPQRIQEILTNEHVPQFLWPLAEGARTEVRVTHPTRQDPVLIVDGREVAAWIQLQTT